MPFHVFIFFESIMRTGISDLIPYKRRCWFAACMIAITKIIGNFIIVVI